MAKIIEKHHKYDETIFLPDLASCHYAKKKVPKADSLRNVPQDQPIENFWALLARAVYAKGRNAKNEAEAELCGSKV
jgi:hypothetical protein